jgi:predicted nucleotidyltransferase
MCSQSELQEILERLCGRLRELLGKSMRDIILFGSYARNEANDDSDIDIMVLTDLERADIYALQWKIGDVVSEILLDYGVLVSPIVENRAFFMENQKYLPFFHGIHRDGVRLSA